MGMFDYIHIDSRLLPITFHIGDEVLDEIEWQTKSLEKVLANYFISESGLHQLNKHDLLSKEEINLATREFIDFTGEVVFVGELNRMNIEFVVQFKNGQLISIYENF